MPSLPAPRIVPAKGGGKWVAQVQFIDSFYGIGDGGDARAAAADDLQRVIWFIEQEEPISWTLGDGSRRDMFYQDALVNAGPTIGDVRVLNLYEDAAGTAVAQDLLVLTPEPTSLLLIAAGGLLILGRR